MAQILVTPNARSPNVRNLKNDKAQNEEQAKQEDSDDLGAPAAGEDFAMLAQNYSEDPASAPNGGDLGFVPESALEKANPELRKMVMSLPPGGISPIIHTQEGYRILKVISKEPAGQRELNDPARAADHPRDAAQPQGPIAARRLLRGAAERFQGGKLPGAIDYRKRGEEVAN